MTSYRTLIRVQGVADFTGDKVYLNTIIPGWNPHRTVFVPVDLLPEGLLAMIESSPGPAECAIYIHAHVDLRAETSQELDFSGPWEISKVHHGEVITDEDGVITDYGVTTLASEIFE